MVMGADEGAVDGGLAGAEAPGDAEDLAAGTPLNDGVTARRNHAAGARAS